MARTTRNLLLIAALGLVLAGCSSNWGWYVISPDTPAGRGNLHFLMLGFKLTIVLSLVAMAFATVVGLVMALLGLYGNRAGRAVNLVYVEFFRAIPVLVMILWVHYGLPVVVGLSLPPFWSGVIALALAESPFIAEVFRAGIQSVDRGQGEAADSLGLTWWDKMRYVIVPQAIRRVLPALGNQFVYMLKMSALVSIIGAEELTRRANELVVAEYRPLEIYSFLILEYLVLVLIASAGVRWLERRMGAADDRRRPARRGLFGRRAPEAERMEP
jgi:polar amino acid transport system permease protein